MQFHSIWPNTNGVFVGKSRKLFVILEITAARYLSSFKTNVRPTKSKSLPRPVTETFPRATIHVPFTGVCRSLTRYLYFHVAKKKRTVDEKIGVITLRTEEKRLWEIREIIDLRSCSV